MTMLQLRGSIGSCVLPWWLFIAVDTLCQHPMRTGHMTVLQSCGLMEFRVPQWCHPMLASTRRTGCCTRIITLYGTRKWIQARTHRCKNITLPQTSFAGGNNASESTVSCRKYTQIDMILCTDAEEYSTVSSSYRSIWNSVVLRYQCCS